MKYRCVICRKRGSRLYKLIDEDRTVKCKLCPTCTLRFSMVYEIPIEPKAIQDLKNLIALNPKLHPYHPSNHKH